MGSLEDIFQDADLEIAKTVIFELEYGQWMGLTSYRDASPRINIAVMLIDFRTKLTQIRGRLKAEAIRGALGEYHDSYRLQYVPDALDESEIAYQRQVLGVCNRLVESVYLEIVDVPPNVDIPLERLPSICKQAYQLTSEGRRLAAEIRSERLS